MRRLAVKCLLLASRYVLAGTTVATPGGAVQRRPATRILREPWTRARRALAGQRAFEMRSIVAPAA
jgi:hypothetical protein